MRRELRLAPRPCSEEVGERAAVAGAAEDRVDGPLGFLAAEEHAALGQREQPAVQVCAMLAQCRREPLAVLAAELAEGRRALREVDLANRQQRARGRRVTAAASASTPKAAAATAQVPFLGSSTLRGATIAKGKGDEEEVADLDQGLAEQGYDDAYAAQVQYDESRMRFASLHFVPRHDAAKHGSGWFSRIFGSTTGFIVLIWFGMSILLAVLFLEVTLNPPA